MTAAIDAIVAILGGFRATIFALIALALLIVSGMQTARLMQAHTDLATANAHAAQLDAAAALAAAESERVARAHETQLAAAAAASAELYERGKTDAQAAADAVLSDLRADNLRLRVRWSACSAAPALPATRIAAAEPDATADDRNASASRIVRAAAACDAQVTALQQFIRDERATLAEPAP
jgi:hypothetical protein